MKIAVLAQNMYAPWIEGIKNNSLLLCKELSRGADVTVVSHSPDGKFGPAEVEGLRMRYLLRCTGSALSRVAGMLAGAWRIARFLRAGKFDAVSLQYFETSFLPAFLVAAVACPKTRLYVTLYSADETSLGYKRFLLRLLRRRISKVFIISEYLRPAVRGLGYADGKIAYAPLSFDKRRYLRATAPADRPKRKVLFSAGPIREAGSFFMVDVAKLMPECEFVFAMRQFDAKSEAEMALLRAYVEKSGVANVTFLRNIPKMEDLLGDVSALALPLQDIRIKMLVPVALLEAMARGTPCFVADLPNLVALVKNGENAIIFDRNDPADLRDKLRAHLEDPRISEGAFRFAQAFPDYPEISRTYLHEFANA